MDEAGETTAMKEALGGLRTKIRDYAIRRPGAQSEADGNVGEVMEREPQIEAAEESPTEELEELQEEPEKRTVLQSFTPQIVRGAQEPIKRGPGRPRKNA